MIIKIIIVFFSLIWLLAVLKVFYLDDGGFHLNAKIDTSKNQNPNKVVITHSVIENKNDFPSEKVNLNDQFVEIKRYSKKVPVITESNFHLGNEITYSMEKEIEKKEKIDVHDQQEFQQPKPDEIKQKSDVNEKKESNQNIFHAVFNNNLRGKKILTWPPLDSKGNIKEEDGYDVLPISNLKVPKFYDGFGGIPLSYDIKTLKSSDFSSKNLDLSYPTLQVGKNEETIFVMIASYRDFQCQETISDLFNRAANPQNVYVGAVDQISPGDIGCSDFELPCDKNPDQVYCKFIDHISIFKVDAATSSGPATARHIGYRLYRGQTYVLQLDAHCQFVKGWDTKIINQWKQTKNEMAVLTSYLSDVQGSITKFGVSTRSTRPIMCNSKYISQGQNAIFMNHQQPENVPVIKTVPMLEPYWAAGFSFARGHFILNVPYDPHLFMVFQGEEANIGIRAFSKGYDLYAPSESVAFHEYAQLSPRRKKITMFWENYSKFQVYASTALYRSMDAIDFQNPITPIKDPNRKEFNKYGVGNVRDPSLFRHVYGINPMKKTVVNGCEQIVSGLLHNTFHDKYLRDDGLGINYDKIAYYGFSLDKDIVKENLFSFYNQLNKEYNLNSNTITKNSPSYERLKSLYDYASKFVISGPIGPTVNMMTIKQLLSKIN